MSLEEAGRQRLAKMKAEFDGRFALPAAGAPPKTRALLLVIAAGRQLALPVSALAGVAPMEAIAAVPARAHQACRGLTAVRGRLRALYCLGALCGSSDRSGGQWMVLPRDRADMALQIERVVGTQNVSLPAVAAALSGGSSVEPGRFDVIKVDAAALRQAIEGLGEVAAALQMVQVSGRLSMDGGASVTSVGGALERAERELLAVRRQLQTLRLVPVSSIFADLERGLRDTATRVGKRVRFDSRGGEQRIDAEILSALRAPLLHLVRNAVDHGIEPAEQRAAAGKPEQGCFCVEVELRGAQVELRFRDDGRGLDRARLLALGGADSNLSDAQLAELAFRDGISSAERVTDLSGRGVGLAAVRATCQRLGGQARSESTAGKGCVITLRLPLDLASRDVLAFDAGPVRALLPLGAVRRVAQLRADTLRLTDDGLVWLVDGEALPVVDVAAIFAVERHMPAVQSAIVVDGPHGAFVLTADRVRGLAHVVIQALPAALGEQPLLAGAAVDGHGAPQMLLDVAGLGHAMRQRVLQLPVVPTAKLPPHLLVIDDSLTTRMLEQTILEAAGYRVTVATSAEAGLTTMRSGRFDMILVDVEMPGMNGFEFIQTARADPAWADVPIAMVTTLASPEHRRRGMEVGAQAYMVKSEFEEGTYLATIRGLVG